MNNSKTCTCTTNQACWKCLRFTSYLEVARAEVARRHPAPRHARAA